MWQALINLLQHHGWVRLGFFVALALLVAGVLTRVGYLALRRITRDHVIGADLVRRTRGPIQWLLPLILVNLVLNASPPLPSHGISLEFLQRLVTLILIGTLTWLVLRSIGALEGALGLQFRMDAADNLKARRVLTQVRVLSRVARAIVTIIGVAAMLLFIPSVRQIGTSLLASAGLAGLALGLAAKPVLSNLLAGVQIAMTQPIRLDDVVIIEGEWGRIEEITGTYVIVHIWDERRLVVPLNWFIENPFQNWTRTNSKLLGTVFLWLDYRVPLQPVRDELKRLCESAPEWDRWVCLLQVTDASEHSMQIRCLVSSADSGLNFDLRCRVREGLIDFIQREYPEGLPRLRATVIEQEMAADAPGRAPPPPPMVSPSP